MRLTIRSHDPIGTSILVNGAATDHRKNPVTVSVGVGKSLKDQHATTLTTAVAIRGRIERPGPPVRGCRTSGIEYRRQARPGDEAMRKIVLGSTVWCHELGACSSVEV